MHLVVTGGEGPFWVLESGAKAFVLDIGGCRDFR